MFHTEYLLFSLQMTPVYIVQDHRWESVCETLETEMISICEWLNNNKLFLNVSKTNYMIMTPSARESSDEITIQLNGQEIERVTETKFLGVILDQKAILITFPTRLQNALGLYPKQEEHYQLIP